MSSRKSSSSSKSKKTAAAADMLDQLSHFIIDNVKDDDHNNTSTSSGSSSSKPDAGEILAELRETIENSNSLLDKLERTILQGGSGEGEDDDSGSTSSNESNATTILTSRSMKSGRTHKSFKSSKSHRTNKSNKSTQTQRTKNTCKSEKSSRTTKSKKSGGKSVASQSSIPYRHGSVQQTAYTSKFTCDDASQRADDIMSRMVETFGDVDDTSTVSSVPQTITSGYYTTIRVWADKDDNSDASERAKEILGRMERLLKDGKKKNRRMRNRGALS